MGCCGSTEEPVQATSIGEQYDNPAPTVDGIKSDIARAEAKAVEAGPERNTFLASVLEAREKHNEDAAVMKDACTRLQGHNRKLKHLIATADAEAVNEAMNGGFLGMGCNDKKLIAALCSRTKSQLEITKKRYRAMYDKDIRDEVKGETGGFYGKMMSYAMASHTDYIIDMLDFACEGWFNNYMVLIELFVMCEQQWLKAGKEAWEGRNDKSLIDYINSQLGSSYAGLCKLFMLLLKGDREDEGNEPDDAVIEEQMGKLRVECEKGFFSSADQEVFIEIIGSNNHKQNARLAEMYENKFSESLSKGIGDKMSDKLGIALKSLLQKRDDFVASRLKKAMDGWGTDKGTLLRMLGGFDDRKMVGVLAAYERKYGLPFGSALNAEIGGNFARAAAMWITTLNDPTGGVESITEQPVEDHSGNAEKLSSMCDYLLLENEMLLRFAASLDVETLAEATKYMSTDDTRFIRTLTTRSKRFLGRISYMYREDNDQTLISLVDESCSDWYAYLAKFLVLQPSQSDALLLDLALEGPMEENDTNALIEFLCARHPRRVRSTKKAWEKRNDASLVDRLSDELHGDLRKIALTMLKGKRMDPEAVDEELADMALAKTQAADLKDCMEDKAIPILCANSPAQNAAIARMFEETYDMSLQRAIGQVFDGNVKSALTSLTLEPAYWYAARLKAAFKGIGSKERTVCRIVGAHDKHEIKAIALAYDDKYGIRLKTDIDAHTNGNFKRLAVAWIDLPDQLEQPSEQIELPELPEEMKAAALAKQAAEAEKEEEEEDFEEVEDPPPPSSSLYKAKVLQWQAKLQKAKAECRPRKTAYFQRLLCMYPPVPAGHQLLHDYADALTREYQKGDEGMVKMWIDATEASTFEDAGTTKELFDEWQDTSEACVKDKHISIGELKHSWGLNKKEHNIKEPPPEEYETPYTPPPAPPAPTPAPPAPTPTPFQPMTAAFGQQGGRQMMMQSMQTTTHTVQQTIVHQPQQAGVQRMAATVPFGVYGGMQMTVQTHFGPMRVTVPPGYGPGSSFTFNVPVRGPMAGMGGQFYA